jgi:hypothetical protein
MKKLEQLLPLYLFKRVHKSFIVSLDRIREFDSETVCLRDKQIPIGDQYGGVLEKNFLIEQAETTEKTIHLLSYSVPLRAAKAS